MLLAREFISYLSRRDRYPPYPENHRDHRANVAAESIAIVIEEELAVEDRLNDEVRDLLGQYEDYMRQNDISYQEMFRRIKNTMIKERKVIRASGRDTGDPMKLSRDKVNDISTRWSRQFVSREISG